MEFNKQYLRDTESWFTVRSAIY